MTLAQPFLAIGIQSDLSIILQQEAHVQDHLYGVPMLWEDKFRHLSSLPCTQAAASPAEVGYAESCTE